MVKDSNPKQLALSAHLSERRARGTKPCRDDSLQFTGRLFKCLFSVERAGQYLGCSSVASQAVHSVKLALTKGFPLFVKSYVWGHYRSTLQLLQASLLENATRTRVASNLLQQQHDADDNDKDN